MSEPVLIPADAVSMWYPGEDDCCGDDHYAWDCPSCGQPLDHWQGVTFPLDVKCRCGAVNRLTKDAAEAAERMHYKDLYVALDEAAAKAKSPGPP
jgi:hypothetical protein